MDTLVQPRRGVALAVDSVADGARACELGPQPINRFVDFVLHLYSGALDRLVDFVL
jgi:hypothetical protein